MENLIIMKIYLWERLRSKSDWRLSKSMIDTLWFTDKWWKGIKNIDRSYKNKEI